MKIKKYNKEIKILVDDIKNHYKKYGVKNIKYIKTNSYYNCRIHEFDCILNGKEHRLFVNRSFNGGIDVKAYECIDLNKYVNNFGKEDAFKILTEKLKHFDNGFISVEEVNNNDK